MKLTDQQRDKFFEFAAAVGTIIIAVSFVLLILFNV